MFATLFDIDRFYNKVYRTKTIEKVTQEKHIDLITFTGIEPRFTNM